MGLTPWQLGSAMPPLPPVQCNDTVCTLYNAYGVWGDRRNCHVQNDVVYPKTEEEVRLAVAYANKNNLKLKVVTKFSHTIPKLACPATSSAMLVSTAEYNSKIEIDAANLAVTVDAGVSLRQLIDKVEEAGLSLVAAPYWEGVSIGGLISTGAHGSSWWGKGGAVHDHVIGLSLVVPAEESQGFAKVIRIEAQNTLLNAAKVSLGELGIISKVKLALEAGFKRSITYDFTDDGVLEDTFIDHAKKYEFGDITWYPSRQKVVYRYDYRVPLNTIGSGVNDFLGFQANLIGITKSVRATEKLFEKTRNMNGKCIMASSFVEVKKLVANGLKNNMIFTGYPVVGHQGKMQTSGSCLYSPTSNKNAACAWDPRINGLFFYETTAIFSVTKFRDFILDVKKLRDMVMPDSFCGVDIYNGFLIRFIKASEAYLGQNEDSVVLDFNYYRAEDASTPRLNQDVWEEVEQMAFFKYGAKPHWAKNRKLAFLNVQSKYPKFNKFMAVKKQLDPKNMFSSEWSKEILWGKSLQGSSKEDGCALEGQCICSEDRHCNPSEGYFCRPGLVYQEARVCRYSSSSMA